MEALILPLVHAVLGPLLDDGLKAYQAYINKEISREELAEKLKSLQLQAMTDYVKSDNSAAGQTWNSFMQALQTTKVVQRVWAYWVASQITFIIWLELGIPFISWMWSIRYPGVGSLDQWAYAAIMASLGLGPLVIKHSAPQIPKI